MKRIGITGQSGFIGTHLAQYVREREDTELVPFEDSYFESSTPSTLNPQPSTLNSQPSTLNPQLSTLNSQPSTLNSQPSALNPQPSTLNPQPSTLNSQPSTLNPQPSTNLRSFVRSCDVIVHLAAASRMPSEDVLYNLNVGLVQQVIDAMEAEHVTPLVMFSSSTHETRDTAYGRAKREGRALFEAWAKRNGASFVGFIFPNIYGPGARVHYASFIANFAWELQHGQEPKILVDAPIRLKYIGNHCPFIGSYFDYKGITKVEVPWDFELKVTDILELFRMFSGMSEQTRAMIEGCDNNLRNLYRTFISYE